MLDAMRGYLHAASGLTELTRKRAQELAQSLLAAGGSTSTGAVAAQVSSVAEELINTAKSNRAAVREMVRGEVEVAVARLGLVPATELERAHRKIAKLEATMAELVREGSGATTGSAAATPSRDVGATRASAVSGARPNRAAVKQAAARASAAEGAAKAAATKRAPAPSTTTAKKTTAKTATAKKTTAKKTTAKKTTAKKTTAKKAASKRAAAEQVARSARVRTAPVTGTEAGTSS